MKYLIIIFLTIGLNIFAFSSEKNELPNVEIITKKVQIYYKNIKTFQADFSQNYKHKIIDKLQVSKGKIFYKNPGLIRFDYLSKGKSFIIDGKNLWIYQPEEKTALVDRCFSQHGLSVSISFLWGASDINKDFNIKTFKANFGQINDFNLLLTPKNKNPIFNKIILVVEPNSGRVKQSVVVDAQGNVNQFIFSNIKINGKLSKRKFKFSPGKSIHVSNIPGSCSAKPTHG